METPVPENTGGEPVQSNEPVNVESAGVAAANAADDAAANADPVKPDDSAVLASAGAIQALGGDVLTDGSNLWHRVDVWKTVFTAHLVHGVDAAIDASGKAVKAFESMFGK